jgi:hypothetical protein
MLVSDNHHGPLRAQGNEEHCVRPRAGLCDTAKETPGLVLIHKKEIGALKETAYACAFARYQASIRTDRKARRYVIPACAAERLQKLQLTLRCAQRCDMHKGGPVYLGR